MTDPAGLAWACARLSNRRYMGRSAWSCTAQVPWDGFHPTVRL